jgi:formylglycine-generating enzyme required for sulfatase activity
MDSKPDLTPVRHVFVSFASADADLAHRVVRTLEESGVRCWISDRDIDPAASYPAAITAAITGSGVLLLLMTAPATQSPHVLREVELAFNTRRPILPVRIAGATPTDDLQYFLSRAQWLDAGSDVDDTEVGRIESRVRELLASPAARIGPPTEPWWRRPRTAAAAAVAIVAAVTALYFWNERVAPDSPIAAPPAEVTPPTASGAEVKINPRDGQEYVWIPPGRFTMGCSAGDPQCEADEQPVHLVEIRSGLWLGRTEVTAGAYARRAPAANADVGAEERLPALAVSWADASAYCRGVGGRLPTEAEWEYAARAGTTTRQYDRLTEIAWFSDNSDEAPHPVGTKSPNAFGLYDMLGNVSEWVRDRYYNAYDDTSEPVEIEEPLAGNASGVARGGSWVSEAAGVRASRRLSMPPDAEEPHIGFRCAIDNKL